MRKNVSLFNKMMLLTLYTKCLLYEYISKIESPVTTKPAHRKRKNNNI